MLPPRKLTKVTPGGVKVNLAEKIIFFIILTTNLAACVCAQNLTNFCPHALISNPNVPKILFA